MQICSETAVLELAACTDVFGSRDDWLRYFYDVKLGVVAGVGYIC